jgi:hypothetical protein
VLQVHDARRDRAAAADHLSIQLLLLLLLLMSSCTATLDDVISDPDDDGRVAAGWHRHRHAALRHVSTAT